MKSGGLSQLIGTVWRRSRPAGGSAPPPAAITIGRGRAAVAIGLALGALLIAGCGSSSSKSEAGTEAFIASANAACETAAAEAQKIKKPTTLAEIPAYVAALEPVAEKLLATLTSLTPPSGKQDEYNKLLNLWRQQIASAKARAKLAKAGDERREQTLNEEARQTDARFDATASEIGLTACARSL